MISRATGWDELRIRSSWVAFGWACAAGIRGARVPRGPGGGIRGSPRFRGWPELVAPFSFHRVRAHRVAIRWISQAVGACTSSDMATRLSDRDDRLANETGPEQRRLPEIPRRAHLVQVHADEVRGEHPDDLLDLKRREPKRLRIADGGRERRIHAVDVDRKVHLVAIDGLHRALDRCVDASLVDIEDADVGQTEALEILPLLAAVGPHSDVDDVFDPDVVRDPPRRSGMGPLVREVRVAEVEVGIDPDDADVFRERPHDGRREAVLPADDDWDLPGEIGRASCRERV